MKQFQIAVALAASLGLATSASAQNVIGSVDWVDQDTVLGWVCYSGNSTTVLPVNLFAVNTATGQSTYLGTEIADRGRDDVGGAGVCGTTPESYFHGFEYTIFPEQLIATQGSYQIRALAGYGSARRQLPGNETKTLSFATASFPTSGIWRTDYDDPNARLVAMVSCIWPFKGANKASQNVDPDPLFLNAGATITQASWESAPWVFSGQSWCLQNDANNPASWYWPHSNALTNAYVWPMSNYWVVSANNELAYSKTQSGPPSQSQQINGGMYSLSAGKTTFDLGIDNRLNGYTSDDTPFLSIGAQMGRGTSGPLGWVTSTGNETYLQFQVQQLSQSASDYHDVAVYIEMMWGGYKRWIGVSLMQATQSRVHWNWNALESFWFPGGEFNFLGAQTLSQKCTLGPNAQIPVLSAATLGQNKQVKIPIRGILQCLETTTYFPNLHPGAGGFMGWEVPRPLNTPIAITGVQLAVEQAPGQPSAYMKTRFSQPTLVSQP